MADPKYAAFAALDLFFDIALQGLAGLVDGEHYFDIMILEYDVHGKVIGTGTLYDNRFISVVTIEGRKIVQWRDYMDSLAAMTALTR